MKEKTDKILTWVLLAVSLVATAFSILFALQSDPDHIMEGVTEVGNNFSGMFDVAFWMMAILIGISIVAILCFLVKKLACRFKDEPGYLKKFLILVVIIAAVLVVSFVLATGNDVPAALLEKNNLTEGSSKLIGAACILCYIIVIAAALAILVTEVLPKSNKKK